MSYKKDPVSLGRLFDHHAERGCRTRFHLSRPFDIAPAGGTEYDSRTLAQLTAETSAWLYASGARAGDRIAIAKDNHWDYLVLACAAARFGALPVLVSGALAPETLQMVLKHAAAHVLVTTKEILQRGTDAGANLTGTVARTVCVDGPAPGAVAAAELRGGPVPEAVRTASYEPMVATHTSGTTGVPKLVVHSAETLMGHLGRTESLPWPVVGMKPWDTVATATPYNHMRMITWSAGTLRLAPRHAVVIDRTDPGTAERMFTRHRPTYVEAAPATFTAWEELADRRPDGPFRAVRVFVSTFDAMHPPTVRRFLAATRRPFPAWLQGWGQSETGPMTFRLLTRRALAARGERHPTTRNVGRPIPGFTGMRVVDPKTMRRVPAGTPGVAFARTDGRCIGYLGEEERWHTKTVGRWWNTGDWVVRSPTGLFRLLDREVDLIPGTSCIELEDVLADRLPELLEAVVLGVPGERPVPVVSLRGGPLDPAAWQRATADLPGMAEPVVLDSESLPRTSTGKVRRHELRERLLGGTATFGTGRWT
ncbi:acyl--CoA ligase [Streptomyces tubbatahanensis]|uniref:Acyl--CoA ligase n=1 Tax=Streptomyces tubbatahanensis TaxID=2923272 RepID=A0ABY3XMT8_9ACTN|nr:class I adenylate-forming enzyme family protein [Streptomyces tubbatahanensis]UNS95727.1 acyl--CoA ligase [Streptomyces tubbatahanensis]